MASEQVNKQPYEVKAKDKVLGEALKKSMQDLFTRVVTPFEFIEEQLSNPELANPSPLLGLGFEASFTALKHFAQEIKTHLQPNMDKSFSEAIDQFLKIEARLVDRCYDINLHLHDIAKDWKCPECGITIPKNIVVKGIRRGPFQLLFVCKNCEKTSQCGPLAYEHFEKHIQPLRQGRWNPRANGFIWNEN